MSSSRSRREAEQSLACADDHGLSAGRNCWRVERASRARALIDADAYFTMLCDALERAEQRIFIIGWDIHALTRLGRSDDDAGAGMTLRERLLALAERNPELEIRILLWDFTMLYAPERLPLPEVVLDWSMPANVELRLDDRLPTGASHHQKIVVIDDRVAFIGGIDLTERRWDTPSHAADDARRVTARGDPYPPFHDVQLALEGAAAVALGELCRERWTSCTQDELPPAGATSDPWPDSAAADWRDIEVGIARTRPGTTDDEPATEILHAYLDAIGSARDAVYIENQFLTSDDVCDALVARLGESDGPEIVLVTQWGTDSWLEESTMGVRRQRFLSRLRRADGAGRLRVLAPCVPGVALGDFNLHSKVMVVDDRWVQIGSANLNNRSMGFDSECDAIVACAAADAREAARAFRNTLLAEHLAVERSDVERAIDSEGSLIAAIEALRGRERSLVDLPHNDEPDEHTEALAELADPKRPLSVQDFLDRINPQFQPNVDPGATRRGLGLAIAALLVAGLAVVWSFTDLGELTQPPRELLARLPQGPAGALAALACFLIGGLVAFPVTALIAASAIAFGPWLGLLYALLGSYASAALTFAIGRALGRAPFERWAPGMLSRLNHRLAQNGLLAIAILRILPIAPFTGINLLAGTSRITLRDFALGTVLGMTPGMVALCFASGQLGAVLRDPTPSGIAAFAVLALLWVGLTVALQRIVRDLERKRQTASSGD